MSSLRVARDCDEDIIKGLAEGAFERIGGVVRDSLLQQVVGWLREAPGITEPVISPLLSVTTAGTLTLAISTMGFAVVMHRLAKIEQQLKRDEEILSGINYKIDLSFYANFRAALDLANSTSTMSNPETRKASLLQAVNRFLEAERHYLPLADIELNNGSRVAHEYLSTLCLAYAISARCYLELEEIETAERHLREGLSMIRPRYEWHISDLLTSNPAAFLHPSLKEQVDLKRLTRVYDWIRPGKTMVDVFEMLRGHLFNFTQSQSDWIRSLPQAIKMNRVDSAKQQGKQGIMKLIGRQDWKPSSWSQPQLEEILSRLTEVLGIIETMIEDERRLQGYIFEVEQIRQRGITFQQWSELSQEPKWQSGDVELVYILGN